MLLLLVLLARHTVMLGSQAVIWSDGALIHLEHYPQALEYAEMLHKRAPESVVSLQFQLYLTALLELPEKRALVVEEMVERRDAGQLRRQEIFNLELFLQE